MPAFNWWSSKSLKIGSLPFPINPWISCGTPETGKIFPFTVNGLLHRGVKLIKKIELNKKYPVELTTDVPEQAHLKDDDQTDWDERARGLG